MYTRNELLILILEQLGGTIHQYASRDDILKEILSAMGGVLTRDSRNEILELVLLESILTAV